MTGPTNPECRSGNCIKCDGTAWDEQLDAPTYCRCGCHTDLLAA